MGAVNLLNATASSRIATASARVSGSKLEMNVPGVARSRSACLS